MSCGVGRSYVSDLVLLWLWRRLATAALIRTLAWEPPDAALKEKAKKKKKRKKENYTWTTSINLDRPRQTGGVLTLVRMKLEGNI